eukprot:TRINITY_DN11224_c0_g1_i1.p1 TRINITY_DN11224_c0_g1~~TRINITY_DN11224_c0_g1_i1.p1  ORF type:complete len:281 (-),score=75.29 TRINITY_DN11224_c0_g1_i1:53-847(-)
MMISLVRTNNKSLSILSSHQQTKHVKNSRKNLVQRNYHQSSNAFVDRDPNYWSKENRYNWKDIKKKIFKYEEIYPEEKPYETPKTTYIPEREWDEVNVSEGETFPTFDFGVFDPVTESKEYRLPTPPKPRFIFIDEEGKTKALGKRKRSWAYVTLSEGTGKVIVNGRNFVDYWPAWTMRARLLEPLIWTENIIEYDVDIKVRGGGYSGQLDAARLGIARALERRDPELRNVLKPLKLLTRDPRKVERKKTGLKKARKRRQWVKR